MRIRKFLNNNAAVVTDDQGFEKVVIGKGIIYGKKTGDYVDAEKVEKTFYLSSDTLNLKFQEVLKSLPMEQVNIVEKIVEEVRLNIGKKISDAIYVSLADHIHFSISNLQKGITIKNGLLLDIKRFYPDEYKLGLRGAEIISQEIGIEVPKDEAGFIALHIVNSETENELDTRNTYRATKIIEEVLEVVKNCFGVDIETDSLANFRFITHLKYFSQRIVNGAVFSGDEKDKELLDTLSKKYALSYECSLNIRTFIRAKYNTDIGYEELLYLTIHIQRAIYSE